VCAVHAEPVRGEVLWSPPADVWETSPLGRFARAAGFDSYGTFHRWSVDDLEGFWSAVATDQGVRWRRPPESSLVHPYLPGARWFPGGTLNYAEHALARAATAPDELAVVAHSQSRAPLTLTWSELAGQVARCAAGLRRLGVAPGDRVAAYAPNIPETLVAFLATASLGAVWSSCAPEFGTRSVIDRFSQIDPVVLVAVDGYRYGTKAIDRSSEVDAIVAALPGLRHVVGLRYLGTGPDGWTGLLAGEDPGPAHFTPVPSDHPLYVLFSSGTTGLPKAIVHGHAGILHEHLKALGLVHGLGPGDVFTWFTTTGWMMWNYLVSGLLTGARIVLFDGDPAKPSLDVLWDLAHDTGCTVFGTSAPLLMACRKAGLTPGAGALRQLGSTGAPLPAEGYRWAHEAVGAGVQLTSIAGGTDVCTAFVGMNPLTPVRAGEISGPLPGCSVEAFDAAGRPCPPGELGELVITAPMPSMPVGFWGDDDGSRYRAAYFADFPGVWRHGDWIEIQEDGACQITGRSDATLNRSGVRLGTADFYAVVEAQPEVADSLVVHRDEGDELFLFVVLADGVELDDELRGRLSRTLRAELSPRHVPDRIEAVPGVPRTLSGKKLEVPVKRVLGGADPDAVASRGSLTDPDALLWFVRYVDSLGPPSASR
jgi:acetoacetyl-CoA synthetase